MIRASNPWKKVTLRNPIVNNQPINQMGPIIPATSTFLLIIFLHFNFYKCKSTKEGKKFHFMPLTFIIVFFSFITILNQTIIGKYGKQTSKYSFK